MPSDGWRPDWDAPDGVLAWMSTRQGGVSAAPFDSLNLARSVAGSCDHPYAVAENRRRFSQGLGAPPVFLHQVHGTEVVELTRQHLVPDLPPPVADASVTLVPGVACTVFAADCLPVLFCTIDGRAVGAAHAGWRGLAAGVLEATVQRLRDVCGCAAKDVLAWLGPCIGPRQFEVGVDVWRALAAPDKPGGADPAFEPVTRRDGTPGWLADLPALARRRLAGLGVSRVYGGDWCTVSDPLRFFSFRRDGLTGRLAAGIALRDSDGP
jgi:YfiH family protein